MAINLVVDGEVVWFNQDRIRMAAAGSLSYATGQQNSFRLQVHQTEKPIFICLDVSTAMG